MARHKTLSLHADQKHHTKSLFISRRWRFELAGTPPSQYFLGVGKFPSVGLALIQLNNCWISAIVTSNYQAGIRWEEHHLQ
jgi:hypothetical protein